MTQMQEFAISSNGDRWFLDRNDEQGDLFVVHRGNEPSGGHEIRTSVQAFLNQSPRGPERAVLLALLGVGDDPGNGAQDSYTSSSL